MPRSVARPRAWPSDTLTGGRVRRLARPAAPRPPPPALAARPGRPRAAPVPRRRLRPVAAVAWRTHRPPPKPVTVVRPTSTAACRCRRFPTGWRPRARPVAFAGRGESGRRRTASCRSRRAPIRGCSRLESAMPSKHGPLAGAARGLVGGGPGWLVDEIEAHRRGWGDQGRPAVRSLTRAPTGIPRRAPGAARGCRPERSVPPPPYSEPEPLVGKHGGKEHPALRLQADEEAPYDVGRREECGVRADDRLLGRAQKESREVARLRRAGGYVPHPAGGGSPDEPPREVNRSPVIRPKGALPG